MDFKSHENGSFLYTIYPFYDFITNVKAHLINVTSLNILNDVGLSTPLDL